MRGTWTAAALIAAMLAGCSGEPGEDPAAQTEGPCLVEAADDYSCAQQDQNRTADQVAHLHDYWGGRSTIRLLEETQGFGQSIISSCDAYPMELFLPPDGATVYQGTGRVDIVAEVDLAPDHRAGPMEIWVKTAAQDAPNYVADLEDGATVTMEVNATAADLPHQVLSAWEFWIYVHPEPTIDDAYCMVQPRGSVALEVDIHKTLPIEPFPGHPDHWGDATELPLLDAYAGYTLTEEYLGSCSTGSSGSHQDGSCQMHWRGFGPQDGHIVPPEAGFVRLTLTAEPGDGHQDAVLGLRFHGADTRQFTAVEPVERDEHVAVYEIDAAELTDGPYATQSQWAFQVVTESDVETYRGQWTLTGSVLRA